MNIPYGAGEGGRKAILSIDDETSFTELLKGYFELRGYRVDVTNDGSKGLELAKRNRYDVALLDLKMEGMDGDEVMRKMRRINPRTRTIFITAYNDSGKTRKRLLDEGAFAFVEKPISSLKDLEETVRRAVEPPTKKGADAMLKILVVDDEIDICDFVKNFFKDRNFEVFVAHDGREALNLVESRRPDIVLLDVKMPVMDGMQALREIKKVNRKSRIIMITAVNDTDRIEEARRLGVYEYITKPLLLEQLERTVLTVAEEIKMEETEGE
ncbi:MAG: response regulator [Candidatus Omnitrophica bacterium]|nr:response regulator [Candidatus Omnitrophota bacterium]